MIEYWHNPNCTKSRNGLALIQERGLEVSVRLYLTDGPDAAQITAAWRALGAPPMRDMMRKGDQAFQDLALGSSATNDELIAAMVANPALIERPIVIFGDTAVIGRPTELVKELLASIPV